jgi:hypothetical protein
METDKQTNGQTNGGTNKRTNIYSIFRNELSLPEGSSDSIDLLSKEGWAHSSPIQFMGFVTATSHDNYLTSFSINRGSGTEKVIIFKWSQNRF